MGFAAVSALWFIEPFIDTMKFSVRNFGKQMRMGVKELLKNEYIKKISSFYILVGSISWLCMLIFNNTLLVQLGHTNQEIGIIFSVLRIINSLVIIGIIPPIFNF